MQGFGRFSFAVRVTFFSLAAALAACGGGGSSDSGATSDAGSQAVTEETTAPTEAKDLFSLWDLQDQEVNIPLDLRGVEFDVPASVSFVYPLVGSCDCDVTLSGEQASGSYSVNNCVYVPAEVPIDPGCNAQITTGTYGKTVSTLTLTSESMSTFTYQ